MENFNPETVELTEEEKAKVLGDALRQKRGILAQEAYNRKLARENILPKFSADDFLKIVLARAKSEIENFSLTTEELALYRKIAGYWTGEQTGLSPQKGLLLSGGVGSGKTTIMRLFAHNPRASYVVKSCRKIASEYADTSQEARDSGNYGENILHRYAGQYYPTVSENDFKTENWGICFDDLGTEDVKANYSNRANVMQQIILNRYDRLAELPYRTHATTNLTAEQIGEYYGERVRSRMREIFNIVEILGKDKRS